MENIKGTGDPIPVSDDEEPTELRIDDMSIAKEISEYMNVNRVNWAELNEANDMWEICDAISAAHSGLPDSLLKESFLFVLESNLSATSSNWNRQHLQTLLRIWKKEVQKIKQIERPTRFIAESFEYSKPVVVVKKRRRTNADKKKTQLQRLMGVGQMLEEARIKFATENGELDVEEDEDGIYTIGGQELSFETWGEINKIEDHDIVHSNYIPPKQKRPRHKISKHRTQVFQNTASNKTSTISPLTNGNNDDFASTENNVEKKVEVDTKKEEQSTKQEKDEGELSESDDDDDSSSSSGSDDLQSASSVARHRRKRRRENERQQGQTSVSNMNSMFQKFYQYRFKIMQSLSLQQKASFLEILKENNGGTSETRQQQITQLMGKFMERVK